MQNKVKTKETELSQLKSKSEKDIAVITAELETLETEMKVSVETKKKAEEEILRCVENISRLEEEKKTKESLMKRNLASLKAAEGNLTAEIENLRARFESHTKTVDTLMREGVTEPVVSEEKQKLITFLTKSIKEKESDLECPVCLETAGGEIFSCIEQHLVCSQCRPRVSECPQCRQPYPPNPIRHRYAEKSVGELEKLRKDLGQMVLELHGLAFQPSAPSLDQDCGGTE